MRKIADFHIHSRYSRACSPALTLSGIEAACRQKGVDIVATGDFTYPAWFESISKELEEISASGLYRLKSTSDSPVRFILSTEISLVYRDSGQARRIHIVLMAPSIDSVGKLNEALGKRFNIRSDGRPILGISAPDFVKLCLAIDPHFIIFPAHIWTPWYAVFGSKSGFDSLQSCFQGQIGHIHAFETGLSSDPPMNWRVPQLDSYLLLSNSDAHSLPNIGREANELAFLSEADVSYAAIEDIISGRKIWRDSEDGRGLVQTIEFYPEEGMYHLDGHRDCHFSCTPTASREHKGICPVCGKPLVIGVLSRVEELSERPEGYEDSKFAPFLKLVELDKIIAQSLGVASRSSRQVQRVYHSMLSEFGSELEILIRKDIGEMRKKFPEAAANIQKMRRGDIKIIPGFDGQYGRIIIQDDKEKQVTLF